MIKGVIFDLDGVLVSTDELHFRAWKQLADEEGIPFSREINHRQRGIGRMESLDVMLEHASRFYTTDEKIAMADRKNTYYQASLGILTPADALPGAHKMLLSLRSRGIKTAIGSASKNAPTILERVGLFDKVDVLVDGNDATASKPDPLVFLLAAKRLGIAAVNCLVIEDAMAGIEAGRRAGMAVFGIGNPTTLPGVPYYAASLAEITPEALLAIPKIES